MITKAVKVVRIELKNRFKNFLSLQKFKTMNELNAKKNF